MKNKNETTQRKQMKKKISNKSWLVFVRTSSMTLDIAIHLHIYSYFQGSNGLILCFSNDTLCIMSLMEMKKNLKKKMEKKESHIYLAIRKSTEHIKTIARKS